MPATRELYNPNVPKPKAKAGINRQFLARRRKAIARILFKCKTEPQVEALFRRHGVNSLEEKIKIFSECMENPTTFYSSGKKPDLNKEYALELQIFLLGEWRAVDIDEENKTLNALPI